MEPWVFVAIKLSPRSLYQFGRPSTVVYSSERKDSVRNLGFVEAVLNSEKGIISSRRNIGEGGAVCCSIW